MTSGGRRTITGWPQWGPQPSAAGARVTVVGPGTAAGSRLRQGPPPALAQPAAGALLTVSEQAWAAIATRVELAAAAPAEIELPGRAALAAAYEAWRTATLPGLVTYAAAVAADCDCAARAFTALQPAIAGGAPLPARVRSRTADAVAAAREASFARRDALTALTARIARFRDTNALADAQVARYVMALGPRWTALAAPGAELDDAAATALEAERILGADLCELSAAPAEALRGAGIAAALRTWRRLAEQARRFAAARTDDLAEARGLRIVGQSE